jgi:molecular chaperone DnaK
MYRACRLRNPAEPPDRVARDIVLGIDFGTSYSTAGTLIGDRVELVVDNGETTIPSVVYLPERGVPEVGTRAVMKTITDPLATVGSVKRLLGVAASDDVAIRRLEASLPFRFRSGPNDNLVVQVGGTEWAPEQIAAMVLSRLRDLAEARFGAKITRAIITASAAAPARYVESIKRAARIAHLDVIQIVPEPIAGAVALGLHEEVAHRRMVVCDFGGGTFDVTAIVQEGLRFTPVATGGDPFLGGDDLDLAMASGIAGAIYRRTKHDILHDTVRRQELLFRCESAKRVLSTSTQARISMKDAYIENRVRCDLNTIVERRWIEPRWQTLLDQATACIGRVLDGAGWLPKDVDHVALIGGTALVPMFRDLAGTLFPDSRIVTSSIANVAVGIGATLLTGRYTRTTARIPVLTDTSQLIGG